MGYSRSAGLSRSVRPSPSDTARLTSSTESGRSVSTQMASEWLRITGTRTQVALTSMSECMILRVSLYIFISSFVYPLSVKTSIWGMTL